MCPKWSSKTLFKHILNFILILQEEHLILYLLTCSRSSLWLYQKTKGQSLGRASSLLMWPCGCGGAVYPLLRSSLCTLSPWSSGLKEKPYQCPPGPTPPLESVSLGVKAVGKVKSGRRAHKETHKIQEKRKRERRKGKQGVEEER